MDDYLFNVMCWALQNSGLKLAEASLNEEDKEKYYTLIGESEAYVAIAEYITKVTKYDKEDLYNHMCINPSCMRRMDDFKEE